MEDCYTIQTADHHNQLFSELHTLQKQGALCDVVLAADDGEVMAHKVVLMAVSKYFREKLSPVVSTEVPRISLKGTSVVELANIIKYMYTGKLLLSKDTMDITLEIAEVLGLQGILSAYKEIAVYEQMKKGSKSPQKKLSIEDGVKHQSGEVTLTGIDPDQPTSRSDTQIVDTAGTGTTLSFPTKFTENVAKVDVSKGKGDTDWTITEFSPDGTSVTYTVVEAERSQQEEGSSVQTSSGGEVNFQYNPYDEQYMNVSVGTEAAQTVRHLPNVEKQSAVTTGSEEQVTDTSAESQSQPQLQEEVVVDEQTQHQDLLTVAIETLSGGSAPSIHRQADSSEADAAEQPVPITTNAEVIQEQYENGKVVQTKIVTLSAGQISNEFGGHTSVYTVALDPSTIREPLKMPRVLRKRTEKEKQAELTARKYRKKKAELLNSPIDFKMSKIPNVAASRRSKRTPRILLKSPNKKDEAAIAADTALSLLSAKSRHATATVTSNTSETIVTAPNDKPEDFSQVVNFDKEENLIAALLKKSAAQSKNPFVGVEASTGKIDSGTDGLATNPQPVNTSKKLAAVTTSSKTVTQTSKVAKENTAKPVTRSATGAKEGKQKTTIRVTSRPVDEKDINSPGEDTGGQVTDGSVVKIHVPSTVSLQTADKTTAETKSSEKSAPLKNDKKSQDSVKLSVPKNLNDKNNGGKQDISEGHASEKNEKGDDVSIASIDSVRSSATKRKGKVPRRLSLSVGNTANGKVPLVRTRQNSRSEQNQKLQDVTSGDNSKVKDISDAIKNELRKLRSSKSPNSKKCDNSTDQASIEGINQVTESGDALSSNNVIKSSDISVKSNKKDQVIPENSTEYISKSGSNNKITTRNGGKRKLSNDVTSSPSKKQKEESPSADVQTTEITSDAVNDQVCNSKDTGSDETEIFPSSKNESLFSRQFKKWVEESMSKSQSDDDEACDTPEDVSQSEPNTGDTNRRVSIAESQQDELTTTDDQYKEPPVCSGTEKDTEMPKNIEEKAGKADEKDKEGGNTEEKVDSEEMGQDEEKEKKETTMDQETETDNKKKVSGHYVCVPSKGSSSGSVQLKERKKKFECETCGKEFSSHQNVVQHLFLDHNAIIPKSLKKLECPQCSFVAYTFKDIDAHLETHTELKLLSCTMCQKTYRTYVDIKKHMLTHKDKTLQCEKCKFTTRQMSSLRTHIMLQHTKVTVAEHSCKFCAYTSRLSGNLRKHLLAAHELTVVTKQSKENRRKYADHEEGTLLTKDGTVFDNSQPLPKMSMRKFDKEKKEPVKPSSDNKKRKRGLMELPYEEFTKELLKKHEQYLQEPEKDYKVMTKNLAVATAHPSFPQASPSVRNTRVNRVYNFPKLPKSTTYHLNLDGNPAVSYDETANQDGGQCHVVASEVEVMDTQSGPTENIVCIETVQEDGEVHQDEMQRVIAISENQVRNETSEDQLLVINSEGRQSLISSQDFYTSLMSKGGVETSQTLEMITALLQAGEQIEIQEQADGVEIQNI